jgi:DNA-binding GntR family transcriptional regulator
MPVANLDSSVRARGRLVRHDIREKLQSIILSGERPPGAKLRQQELAAQFGVAQGVVREALLELQAYGLVETIDNRGVYVSRIDRQKLLEAFEVREMHEGLAARLCCERVTRAEIRSLVELAHEIYQLAADDKSNEMASQDRNLHARLIHLSGNSMLTRLADNYRVLGKIVRANRDPVVVRDEHLAILKAIEDCRTDEAERLMREHVAAARIAVEESFKAGGFTPQWVV